MSGTLREQVAREIWNSSAFPNAADYPFERASPESLKDHLEQADAVIAIVLAALERPSAAMLSVTQESEPGRPTPTSARLVEDMWRAMLAVFRSEHGIPSTLGASKP